MEGRATKRYATLAALTLALGGAVFLNWSFAGRTPQAGTHEQRSHRGESHSYVP